MAKTWFITGASRGFSALIAAQAVDRGADNECRSITGQVPAACKHLIGRQVSEQETHCFSRIDAMGDRQEKLGRSDGILGEATNNAKVCNELLLAKRGHTGPDFFDRADQLITWSERKRPLEIWITSAPYERVCEASARGEHFDSDFALPKLGSVDS